MADRRADPVRRAAWEVLRAVREDDAYTNLSLPRVLGRYRLSGRDAGFATELAAGTLRRRGTYDAVLAACVDRPLDRLDAGLLDVLRLGCHQLLSMRVPPHAAISTSVDLARREVGRGPSGLANAVLRKVARDDLGAWLGRVAPDPGTDPVGATSVAHSHPRWVVEELSAALAATGREAELADLLAADNESPRVVLAARPGRSTREELPGEATSYSPFGARLAGGDPGEVPAVAEGRAGVQDEGSQLVALALASAPVAGPDARWLDLCAGPGGKAALLAGLAAERGARLVANEVQEHRAGLVRGALAGADGVEAVTVHDGRRGPWPAGSFDRVLLDAPCSGLGALRRRPEARWRKSPGDLAGLVSLQGELLESALALVRPGGVVLYATCTPVLGETRDIVAAALAKSDEVTLEDVAPMLPQLPDAPGPLPGTVQLWPHRHGTDAMFLALLRRSG